jgi:transposase
MSRMVIDDEMWSRLEKLLPKPKGRHGKDERLFMEAICWMLRTGAAWRDLPPTMVYCAQPQFEAFWRGYFWVIVVFNAQRNSGSIVKR